jgi:hypothetical protein
MFAANCDSAETDARKKNLVRHQAIAGRMLSAGSVTAPIGLHGRRHHPARAAGCTGMVLGAFSRSTRQANSTPPPPRPRHAEPPAVARIVRSS